MQNKDIIQERINQKIMITTLIAFVISFVYWNHQNSSTSKSSRSVASVAEGE